VRSGDVEECSSVKSHCKDLQGKTAKAVASGALMAARMEALAAGLGRRRFVAAVLKAGVETVLVHTKTLTSGKYLTLGFECVLLERTYRP
jgi:hypothetical protein